ncbi:valine--tRNA ligase [Janthinobacterium sp. B9-8]|uniref:valine--tRNA ligase n=1 Tax=Janthinobacterium sp. B9-8 TaxID=1236179 RepID=UPI00061D07BB|nr:valine--tRNA ligase [Janthinobacterium sp. B9-8]AMC36896.1 valine--tRNA ligase [Janthinobacterium sp. B9-8]
MSTTPKELAKSFEPAEIESRYYPEWEKAGYFQPNMQSTESFCIQLPPPNVTGTLHMGHAFNQTIMDGLTRYHRMKGENTLWQPGTDHAGIATQIVVERQLDAQGISRHDLGREKFVEKVWEWKKESGATITEQMRRMGASVDWKREYFTMDEQCSGSVTEVFVSLFEQGLIYRGKRLSNWDPKLGTAISDLEVVSEEEDGHMWHIKYPVVGSDEFIVVATTRPETLLGDVAVAVNPEDERFTHLLGKTLSLPLTNREIPVIADDYVDAAFGTGLVKITPAHDFNDYQVGKRHNTQLINVMSLEATILAKAQVFSFDGDALGSIDLPAAYAGLTALAARKAMLADLDAQGLLLETKKHKLMVPRGDRTGSVIEPLLTDQWFMAMSKADETGQSITEKALQAVADGEVKFVPENWVNTYNQWLNNIQDWCISRQLWWGHQIPAWYDEDGKVYVARNQAEAEAQAPGKTLRRDVDVLDTWFSAALVPFSTLGWKPGQSTPELDAFLPSSVLVTGFDIIFFWVARMIMMTKHFTGKVPFKHVYIHGLVRDGEGQKMSKSEGNVLDPVDLIDGIDLETLLEKRTSGLRRPETAPKVAAKTKKEFPEGIPAFGTDALRFTFASLATLGRSINFDQHRCEGYRNFCNKLWNATRYVLMNVEGKDVGQDESLPLEYSFADQWMIGRLQQAEHDVTTALDTFRFDLAAQGIYEFVWNDYCDWYIELAKVQLQTGNEAQQRATRRTLVRVLETTLRMAHPIIPFITEELWQVVAPLANAKKTESIMVADWPVADLSKVNEAADAQVESLKALAFAVRNLRGEMGLPPSVKTPLLLEGGDELAHFAPYLMPLAKLASVNIVAKLPDDDAPVAVAGNTRLMLKVEIDKAAESARLTKEIGKLSENLERIKAKFEKPGYLDKAPAHLVEKDQGLLIEFAEKLAKLQSQLAKLQ